MENEIKLRECKQKYQNGVKDISLKQIKDDWNVWFCDDDELPIRTKNLVNIINGITNHYLLDNFKVRFENCRSMSFKTDENGKHNWYNNPLYDKIQSTDTNSNNFFRIRIDDVRDDFKYFLFYETDKYCNLYETNGIEELINYINNNLANEFTNEFKI